jgi:hypothetical protein
MDSERDYWISVDPAAKPPAPPPAPAPGLRPARSVDPADVVGLALVALFLVDTFLPWQRVCLSLSGNGFRFGGCFSAGAWSGTAAHFGQAAGIFAIIATGLLGVRVGGVDLGAGGRTLTKGAVYAMAIAASVKWVAVMGKLESVGAWFGILLLLAIAIAESIERLKAR